MHCQQLLREAHAKTWPSQKLRGAFAQTFHTKVPAREACMGDARTGEKNFLPLILRIAGIFPPVRAFVRLVVARYVELTALFDPKSPLK